MALQKIQPSYKFNEEQLKQLRKIAPEAFKDNILDFSTLYEALSNYLEEEDLHTEHFGLLWPGKSHAKRVVVTPPKCTLLPLELDNTSSNIFIEGENMEVLKLLQKSYNEKIKIIYIDPPYNTGNDMIYLDDYSLSDEEYSKIVGNIDEQGKYLTTNTKADGRYHSKWLSMIYPRIKLASSLLSKEGFLFISIDENEVHNLKQICNEIFGEENFISCIANINNPKGRSDDKYIATAHEYLLIYKKGDSKLGGFDPEDKVIKRYNKIEEGQKFREIDLRKTGEGDRKEDRPKMYYYFYYNEKTKEFYPSYEEENKSGFLKINPTRQDGSLGRWRWGFDTTLANMIFLEPKWMEVRKKWTVIEKDFLKEDEMVKPTSAWSFKDVNSERGSEQFVELGFDKEVFPKPKPLGLLKRILKIATNPKENEIVLDFFAGSGSFAHACMEYNKETNNNIKYICIQMQEIIEEKHYAYSKGYRNVAQITLDRIKKAAKILNGNEHDIKVFSLGTSSFKKWINYNGSDIKKLETLFSQQESSLVDEWKFENLFVEILLIEGFPLDSKIEVILAFNKNKIQKVTSDFCEHSLFICLDKKIQDETIKNLSLGDNDIFICLDNAVTDQDKARLDDKGLIKTI